MPGVGTTRGVKSMEAQPAAGFGLWRRRTLILLPLYCLIRLNLAVTALHSFSAWPTYIYILWYKYHSARLKPGWAHFGLRPSCTGRAGRPLLVSLPPTHPKCKYIACNQSTILCSCDIYQCKKLSEFLVFQRFFSNGHCDKHTTLTWIWMTKNSDFSSFLFVVRLRGG